MFCAPRNVVSGPIQAVMDRIDTKSIIILGVCFISCVSQVLSAFITEPCGSVQPIYGMVLKRHVFQSLKTLNSLHCSKACDNEIRCQSFNYFVTKEICELNNRTREARLDELVEDKDGLYIKRFNKRARLGSIPELPADSCKEIKASEGEVVSGYYWLVLEMPRDVVQVFCDMQTEGTIKGTCSSPSQKHTTGAYRGSNNQCGIGTENLGVSLCLLEQTLVTPTAFNSVVRGERHWFFTVYSKNPGNLYDNVNDVDECSASIPVCHASAQCVNTLGSFNCLCPAGFTGGLAICTDIDECASGDHKCLGGTATCTNTAGSYNCSCKTGYVGDGTTSCVPTECQSYQSLTDGTRKITYSAELATCDYSVLTPGWYRFEGAAGTKIATSCVPINHCGTQAPGWLKGAHPTVADGEVTRQACFHYYSDCCVWSINIQVRNCSDYFVYYINRTPTEHTCHLRYCGGD